MPCENLWLMLSGSFIRNLSVQSWWWGKSNVLDHMLFLSNQNFVNTISSDQRRHSYLGIK